MTGQYEPEWLEKVEPTDFWLEGYQHHAPLTAPMAVEQPEPCTPLPACANLSHVALIRTLLICLMALTLPLQGVASALSQVRAMPGPSSPRMAAQAQTPGRAHPGAQRSWRSVDQVDHSAHAHHADHAPWPTRKAQTPTPLQRRCPLQPVLGHATAIGATPPCPRSTHPPCT